MYIHWHQPYAPKPTVTAPYRAATAADWTGVVIANPHLRPGDTIPAHIEPS